MVKLDLKRSCGLLQCTRASGSGAFVFPSHPPCCCGFVVGLPRVSSQCFILTLSLCSWQLVSTRLPSHPFRSSPGGRPQPQTPVKLLVVGSMDLCTVLYICPSGPEVRQKSGARFYVECPMGEYELLFVHNDN